MEPPPFSQLHHGMLGAGGRREILKAKRRHADLESQSRLRAKERDWSMNQPQTRRCRAANACCWRRPASYLVDWISAAAKTSTSTIPSLDALSTQHLVIVHSLGHRDAS